MRFALRCFAFCGHHGSSVNGLLVRWGGLSSDTYLPHSAYEYFRYWPRLQASWFLQDYFLGVDRLAYVDFCCGIRTRLIRRDGRKISDLDGWRMRHDGALPQFSVMPELRLRALAADSRFTPTMLTSAQGVNVDPRLAERNEG